MVPFSHGDKCPSCGAPVGKLYLQCKLCNILYCEDCLPPEKHKCPKLPYKNFNNDLPKEDPPLTPKEIKKRIAEGKGTLDTYICPRCVNIKYMDRYVCPYCRNDRNIKCPWCGNHFCERCIDPWFHKCPNFPPMKSTTGTGDIIIEQPKTPIKSKAVTEEPKAVTEELEAVKEELEAVKEELKKEKEKSIWHRLLSIFGFGN